jgi:hypothetical protein
MYNVQCTMYIVHCTLYIFMAIDVFLGSLLEKQKTRCISASQLQNCQLSARFSGQFCKIKKFGRRAKISCVLVNSNYLSYLHGLSQNKTSFLGARCLSIKHICRPKKHMNLKKVRVFWPGVGKIYLNFSSASAFSSRNFGRLQRCRL